ncbi:hypothetical protein CPCC7001_971 [Cyanobium sp. PCC 7001]|nr:hypothetical protein CPCC7001_971 [Cyanobium sp. PCC 7001]
MQRLLSLAAAVALLPLGQGRKAWSPQAPVYPVVAAPWG